MTEDGMHRNTEMFKITSLQEAEDFAAYISKYGESTLQGYDICDHIRNIYNYSRVYSTCDRNNGKLLNAYIDLELTYLFMLKDTLLAGGTHNRLNDTGKIGLGSVLKDIDLFSGKMDVLYALSSFTFRIRAFWDKYMGVLFLLYESNQYENYIKNQSRKKFFMQHAEKWPDISIHLRKCLTNIVRTLLIHSGKRQAAKIIDCMQFCVPFPKPFLEILRDIITMVDNIRTPEAHGPGSLRKWTLANIPINRSKDFSLMNHWNIGNEFMQALRKEIAELAAQRSSSR